MNWIDEGIFLNARTLGESASVVTILTSSHGRQAGLVRGGASRRQRAILQTGNFVQCAWRGRLQENLGTFTIELIHPIAATLLNNGMSLAGLSSACALVEAFLPEGELNAAVFLALRRLLKAIAQNDKWFPEYVKWEVSLLSEMGFGLSLEVCAATGQTDNLRWVSPKTGKAVSAEAGAPYADRLLPLSQFLISPDSATFQDLEDGFELRTHFLARAAESNGCVLPPARNRLLDSFSRTHTTSCVKTPYDKGFRRRGNSAYFVCGGN